MPDLNDDPVTSENPGEVEGAGSESVVASSDAASRSDQPDEAYKGLQRRLSAKDREIERLKHDIQEKSRSDGSLLSPQAQQVITGLIQKLAEHDQPAAIAMAQGIRQQFLEAQNQQLTQDVQSRQIDEQRRHIEEQNMAELKAIAVDLGADPESTLVDYGDSTMYLSERMRLVRETAKAAAKPATPTPPKPTVSTGEVHNSQPGVPPTPKPGPKTYTQEEYAAALSAYRGHPCVDHLKKAETIKEGLLAQAA